MSYKIPTYTPPRKPTVQYPPGPVDDRQLKVLTVDQIQTYLTNHFKNYSTKNWDGRLSCCNEINGPVYGHSEHCKFNPYRSHFNMCCGQIGHIFGCKYSTDWKCTKCDYINLDEDKKCCSCSQEKN